MTSVIIPDFILKLFEKEISKVIEQVVEKMCDEYDIDVNDAKNRLKHALNVNLDIVDEEVEHVKIVKKHSQATANNQDGVKQDPATICEARLFIQSQLAVRQCSRSKLANCRFCGIHQKLFEQNKLKWGTMNDEKPEEISTAKLKQKVKKTLY